MALFDIGQRIQIRRKQLGLNQDQLAELASLNRVTIAKYESGKVEPGAQALARIADALETTVDWLLGRQPEEPEQDWPWPEDETLLAFGRAMKQMSPEKREKIMQMARVMFAEDFPDAP